MSDSLPSKDELREAAVAYHSTSHFELPSSGSNFSSPVLNPTEYVLWCEEMRRALNLPPDEPAHRLALKTSKEFIL
ncbi:MAG TPA: hypothetical protein VG938_11645 [Verrucomicrobiae bacterium]|jgi:hypothetical protein|nr:hypothetical protein [Verrucomicrobiae bacterium]